MSLLSRIIAAVQGSVIWAAFDLQREDSAAAQVVVLVDPVTGEPYAATQSATLSQKGVVPALYAVQTAFTGGSVGDILSCTTVLDVSASPPAVAATVWRNLTTGADLVTPPVSSRIIALGSQGLTDAQLRANPIRVTVDSSAELEVKNDSGSPLSASLVAPTYADKSVFLSAQQASGASAVIGINASRKAILIVPPTDCTLAITAGATSGLPLYGGIPNLFVGGECPANSLFVIGLADGDPLTIWEA